MKSYLDPPIENYRYIYSGKLQNPNSTKANSMGPNNSKNFYFIKSP